MESRQYYVYYRDPKTGVSMKVYTYANDIGQAKMIFEGQYGAKNLNGLPHPVN